MKIINIVPGFGGTFYCGNCLRDSVYVKTLRELGHEAYTLPVYLPISLENCNSEYSLPVFYGAVSLYLRQNFKLFENMPLWLEKFFNSDFMLKFAASMSSSTRAEGLEEMTISMLKGADGRQHKELEELIYYLKHHEKPDVIHLSNALLLGMAKRIKDELQIPVVCSLQDEDVWVDASSDKYREFMWNLLAEKAQDVDAFVAVSKYFATLMQSKMRLPDHKLHVAYIGTDPDRYTVYKPNTEVPVIGYLSRTNDENGFEVFIDAFILLKSNSKFKNAKIKVTGGHTGDDNKFISKQLKKLKRIGAEHDIEFVKDFTSDKLPEFFNGMSFLSVPVLAGEAFGLYQLEAYASGIPTVQPNLGAFSEIAEVSQAGVIYEPNTPEAICNAWVELFEQPEKLLQLSQNGVKAVENIFNNKNLAEKMVEIYADAVIKNKLNQ